MEKQKIAVVAIGGNALSDGNTPTSEQLKRAYEAAKLIENLVLKNYKVVVVHGNGPQVGIAYLRQLAGVKENIPPLNLALCDALTQAEIGTMLELAIINTINQHKPDFEVLTIVSQVEVNADDEGFKNPTKPVGPFYEEKELDEIKKKFGDWVMKEDAGRGYRRVVPSPRPIKVFASPIIPEAFRRADVIITGGGGGIPVIRKAGNTFELVDAVIDKDRTAALIAEDIGATHFFLLTGVPHVLLNFGKPEQEDIFELKVKDAKRYLEEGQFPAGSMGPKIEAAIDYVEKTGGEAIITNAENIKLAIEKREGTRIIK